MAKQSNKGSETEDLEELLSQLTSDESRHKLIISLLKGGKDIPWGFIKDALDGYAERNSLYMLTDGVKTDKQAEKIIEILEKYATTQKPAKWYGRHEESLKIAARIAYGAGMLEKATELYDRAGDIYESGNLLLKRRKFEEAIAYFIKHENYEKAASVYKKLGRPKEEKEMYKKAIEYNIHYYKDHLGWSPFERAIELAEKIRWHKKAKELKIELIKYFIKEEHYEDAGKLAEETKEYWLASQAYFKKGKFKDAWRAAKKGKIATKYLTFCRNHREDTKMDTYTQYNGFNEFFTESFGGDDLIKLVRKEGSNKGTFPFIIDIYEKRNSFHEAAKAAKESGQEHRASCLYERAVDFAKKHWSQFHAAKIAEEAGLSDLARGLYAEALTEYEKEGKFKFAKIAAEKAGLHDKAEFYKRILRLSG